MLPAEIVAHLEAAGLGLVAGTNLHAVPFPDSAPDASVAIVERAGDASAGTFGARAALEHPRFSVLVRGTRAGAAAARALGEQIKVALDRQGPLTLRGTLYYDLRALRPVYGPAYDRNERPVYSLDCEATKEASA